MTESIVTPTEPSGADTAPGGEAIILCVRCSKTTPSASACCHCGASPYLAERYELIDIAGRGGAGTTYKARVLASGKQVAVKEILVHRLRHVDDLGRIEREAVVLRNLDHPGVPPFIEAFSLDLGRTVGLYLVREYVEGESLRQEQERRRYDVPKVFLTLAELFELLSYLHSQSPPVVHRDIKPDNIIRRPDGGLSLVDFGIAVLADVGGEGNVTTSGTIGFMPPEQLTGFRGPALDAYAVGAVAVCLLSGRNPAELLDADQNLQWSKAVTLAPARMQYLASLLEVDADKRPKDCEGLAREARRLATAGEDAGVAEKRTTTRAIKPGKWLAGLCVLAAAASAIYLGTKTSEKPAVQPVATTKPSAEAEGTSEVDQGKQRFSFWRMPTRPSACAKSGTCLDISEQFEDLKLDAECGDWKGDGFKVPSAPKPLTVKILGRDHKCTLRKIGGLGCTVSCIKRFHTDDWDQVEKKSLWYVDYVHNRYGPSLSADVQGVHPHLRARCKWQSGNKYLEIETTPGLGGSDYGTPSWHEIRIRYGRLFRPGQ